ncbi:hypothetical protein CEK25_003363 [Fusarium fujikuroi]|nr:hypothetical protein CEK25_003363 [Fusarium fujikuroi]
MAVSASTASAHQEDYENPSLRLRLLDPRVVFGLIKLCEAPGLRSGRVEAVAALPLGTEENMDLLSSTLGRRGSAVRYALFFTESLRISIYGKDGLAIRSREEGEQRSRNVRWAMIFAKSSRSGLRRPMGRTLPHLSFPDQASYTSSRDVKSTTPHHLARPTT